jgi:hypothetical protein
MSFETFLELTGGAETIADLLAQPDGPEVEL